MSTNLPNPLTVGSPYFSDFTWGVRFVGSAQPQSATFDINAMRPAAGSQVTILPTHGRTNQQGTFQSEITADASGAIGIDAVLCLVLLRPNACDTHGLLTLSHQITIAMRRATGPTTSACPSP